MERETQKGRGPIRDMWQASYCCGQLELSILGGGGHWQAAENKPCVISMEGEEAGIFIYQLVGPFLETENPCDFWAILLAGQCPPQPGQSPHSEAHRCSKEHLFVHRD